MSDTVNESPAPSAPDTLNDERAHRLAKRAALMEAGSNPYPEHADVTDYVADIERAHAELEAGVDTDHVVKIGGRVMARRGQGKIAFVVVRDATGEIQLFCRVNDMSEEAWGAHRRARSGRHRGRGGARGAHQARPALHRAGRGDAARQGGASAA